MDDDGEIYSYGNIKTKKDGNNYYSRVQHICEELFNLTPVYGVDLVIENQYLGVSPKVYV